jgi:2-oxo-4-hydroxy-4-carboxy--5-ureidoimidazoline (OHCU) decarboxylase
VIEVTPHPDDAQRAAIEAALEAEKREQEQAGLSPWAKTVLPVHDAHDEPHP